MGNVHSKNKQIQRAKYVILYTCKAELNALKKGSAGMNEMTASQIVRLIEWLRSNGFTEKQIVECIEYINK